MATNLLAACRVDGALQAKRIQLDAIAQQEIQVAFETQEAEFRDGRTEIDFNGDWKPDEDEIFSIDITPEATVFQNALNVNVTSMPTLDPSNIAGESIKALFTQSSTIASSSILVQKFSQNQILGTRHTFLQSGNVFKKLQASAFSLAPRLTLIIEAGKIKFLNQQSLRSILEVGDVYKSVTDQSVREFMSREHFHVDSIDEVVDVANQVVRRMIQRASQNDFLTVHGVEAVLRAAEGTKLKIRIIDGKIVMPSDARELRSLMQFLNEARYQGPISGDIYVSNSQKRLDQ